MKLVAQWYSDENEGGLFRKTNGSRFIAIGPTFGEKLSRTEFKTILETLGFRFGRWRRTEWGFEATVQHVKLPDTV